MSSMKFQAARGTHDILPFDPQRADRSLDSYLWRQVEDKFAMLARQYGYDEIETPTFEETDLFCRTSGETSDIVTKQMYTFEDKGGRSLTLKPEGTAPVMRAILEHSLLSQGSVLKLWYYTTIFRYERPQKGRYRQAHQLGCELLGVNSPKADAEIIEFATRFYQSLGLSGIVASINCIGRQATREKYRGALLGYADSYLKGLDTESRAKIERNPLRLLDSKDPAALESLAGAPSVLDYLEDESRAHFDELQTLLTEAGIPYQVSPEIVRGLDYYTDTVFEVLSTDLGAQSALCGGGRYDGLVKDMGGPPTPSVGFALGIERCCMVMQSQGLIGEPPGPDAVVIVAAPAAEQPARTLLNRLRQKGFSVQTELTGKSLKGQLKWADKVRAKVALILGEDELVKNVVTFRTMATGEQVEVGLDEIEEKLRS